MLEIEIDNDARADAVEDAVTGMMESRGFCLRTTLDFDSYRALRFVLKNNLPVFVDELATDPMWSVGRGVHRLV